MADRLHKLARQHGVPLLGYTLLALLLTWPLVLQFTTAVPGDSVDSWQNMWNMWWLKRALLEGHNPFYSTEIYYPGGASLLLHTLNPFNFIISLPFHSLFGLVVAYNVALIFSLVASGYAAYLIAVDVSGNRSAGLLAGVVFASSGYIMAQALGHLNLIAAEWVLFAVLALRYASIVPSVKSIALAGICLALNVSCDWQYFLFALVWSGWYLLVVAWNTRSLRVVWPVVAAISVSLLLVLPILIPTAELSNRTPRADTGDSYRIGTSADLTDFLIPSQLHPWWGNAAARAQIYKYDSIIHNKTAYLGVVALALACVGVWARRRPQRREDSKHGAVSDTLHPVSFRTERNVVEWSEESRLAMGGIPYSVHHFFPRLVSGQWLAAWKPRFLTPLRSVRNDTGKQILENAPRQAHGSRLLDKLQKTLFPQTPPGLAFWHQPTFWLVSCLVFVLLALGPRLQIGGIVTDIPMPSALFYKLPFVRISRVPIRFLVVVMLTLSVLAAFGTRHLLATVAQQAHRPLQTARLLLAVLIGLVILDNVTFPYPMVGIYVAPVYAEMGQDPDEYAVLEMPFYERTSVIYMFYQAVHGKPLVGGNLSRDQPYPLMQQIPMIRMFAYASPAPDIVGHNARQIASSVFSYFNIRYLILHSEGGAMRYNTTVRVAQAAANDVPPRTEKIPGKSFYVYRVVPPSDPLPFLGVGTGWSEPEPLPRGAVLRSIQHDEAELLIYSAIPRNVTLNIRLHSEGSGMLHLSRLDATNTTSDPLPPQQLVPGVQHVTLTLAVDADETRLRLRPDGAGRVGVERASVE